VPPDLEAYRRAAGRLFYRKADLEVPDATLRALPAHRRAFAASASDDVARVAARALGLAACRAEPVPGGTLHAVFIVRAPGGRTWYARTSLPDLPAPAAELLVDRLASAAAATHGVPVATVRHVDLERADVPFDLELLDAAPGRPAGPEAAGPLGAVLAALHGVAGAGWGLLDPTSPTPRGLDASWRDFVLRQWDAHVAACRADGALGAADADRVRRAVREAEPVLATAPGALCHGDLATPNVLADGRDVTALLDWEDAVVGDPLFDLAGWGTFVAHQAHRAALLAGYRTRAALPADAEVRYWLYAVRILLAKTVHRRRFGYAETDRIPAADRIRPALAGLTGALGRGA
jgi:aminoglycoside phosphotransferase (APT) family kinase protein